MKEDFLQYIKDQDLIAPHERILVAVSGGVDSMVLMHLLNETGFEWGVAHCNFNLRGEASNQDQQFVLAKASSYSVPYYTTAFDTHEKAQQDGASIEMAARELRYTWFAQIMKRHHWHKVATAHHLNDNLETALFNFIKGTGIAGLRGIPAQNDRIIRPMLCASKEKIIAYAKEEGLEWREDASNAEDIYARNKIRNNIIPIMREINPSLEATFAETLKKLQATEGVLQNKANELAETTESFHGQEVYIQLAPYHEEDHAALLLYENLRDYGFSYQQCEQILTSREQATGKQFISHDHEAVISRGQLVISIKGVKPQTEPVYLDASANEVSLNGHQKLQCQIVPYEELLWETGPNVALIDYDRLQFPLKIRSWENGDWFIPLGMQGKKKLSDFMIDHKIPLNLKKGVLVLQSGDDVAWVVGQRIDERYKISPETKQVYKITLEDNHEKSI